MLYSRLPAFVLGFHGCDRATAEFVVSGKKHLKRSQNDYDWLGHGIYFWENDPVRAMQWANEKARRMKAAGKNFTPAVVGAAIDLGECLNLLDRTSNRLLSSGYKFLKSAQDKLGLPMPVNSPLQAGSDVLLRSLDCAAINSIHDMINEQKGTPFDSVRAAFIEGPPVYPNSTFRKMNHVQICVRSISSIKGNFHVLPMRKG